MSQMVEALNQIEREVSLQKGPFTLFALFEREDLPNRWDLVVSAPWIEDDNVQAIKLLAGELKRLLPPNQVERVSTIVLLGTRDASVVALTSRHSTEHGRIEVTDASSYGFPVERGYLITSRAAA
jgi:hypothetical protein